MHDAVYVLVEAFNKVLRKKPDMFRPNKKNTNGQSPPVLANGSRIDCNSNAKWATPWEHGDKISRFLRKVRWNVFYKDFSLLTRSFESTSLAKNVNYKGSLIIVAEISAGYSVILTLSVYPAMLISLVGSCVRKYFHLHLL